MFEREKVVEVTEENAPFAPEEERGIWKIRRWNWYQKQQALHRSMQILDEEKGVGITPMEDYHTNMIHLCAIESPIPKEELKPARIMELDADVGDMLLKACREVNGLTKEEKADFTDRPDSEKDTPG